MEEINEEWEVLVGNPNYEICRSYPHQIRKITNKYIVKESLRCGYVRLKLNEKDYQKHRLIALQWIPNTSNLPMVDHINHIRTDNRIENLRWVSAIQNANNLSKYRNRDVEYVVELPDDVIVVNIYGNYRFNGYYFANDVFYKDTGNGDYRIVPWHYYKSKNVYNVGLSDENTIMRTISKKTFYKLYGLD